MFLEEKETKLKYVELRRGGGGRGQTNISLSFFKLITWKSKYSIFFPNRETQLKKHLQYFFGLASYGN